MLGKTEIMYLFWVLSCLLFVVVTGNVVPKENETVPALKWPKRYTVQIDKMSLTAGWVEDITYWRASKKSRVDYNKGAVKKINWKSKTGNRFGVKYEIHPMSTEEEKNVIVCTRTAGTLINRIKTDKILPDVKSFERNGKEVLEGREVEKFTYKSVEDDVDSRQIFWALYNAEKQFWQPIRYEVISYNTWLDNLKKHEVWNFYNYNIDYDENVFDAETKFDCEDQNEKRNDASKRSDKSHIANPYNSDNIDNVFNTFKRKYNKIYENRKEHNMRKSIFQERLRLVIENNRKNTGYTLAINKFADRTPEEMKKHMGLIQRSKRESGTHPFPYTKQEVENLASELPENFDLRDLGVISPVRDQEECGSCWTFGTTATVEGALARKNGGRLLRLANQALIDCAWGFGTAGCNGGYDIGAYKWMMEHGLPTEEEYGPYENQDGFCRIDNMTTTYPILGFTNVTPFSVDALKVALINHGPLSVSIDATDNLSLYKGGILYDTTCNPTQLNHEVSLVGYGKYNGEEYWIIKNSWGQEWGIDGYVHLSIRDNSCGITNEPTYVVI